MKTNNNNNHNHAELSAGLTLGDIYYILFRHKWKIILLSLLGITAAGAFYVWNPPPFQSEAKLIIRYVLDNRPFNPPANNTSMTSPNEMGQSIVNSEIEILTSFDLAEEVATNVGPAKILAPFGGGDDPIKAAQIIQKNLVVEAPKQGNVLHISFHHPDPSVVQPVLRDLIASYLDKHLQVHRAMGTSDDFLTEETAQLRSQIAQTENELRTIKTNAGIISVTDAEKSYTEQIALTREALFQAQAELAEHEVIAKPDATNAVAAAAPVALTVPANQLDDYQNIYAHLDYLQKRLDNYLTVQGYTEQNELVKEVRGQIAEATKLKNDLEQKYPALAGLYLSAPGSSTSGQQISAVNGMESVRALQSKIAVLNQQLNQLQTEAANVDAAASRISDLQQQKEMQQKDYQYFASSLEQARIDEAMGPGRVSNISAIQTPSPPFKDRSKNFKAMAAMIFGGIFGGIAWAFLIELYFDTSVKRSHEIETKLRLPLFLTIPDISRNGQRHLALAAERRLLQSRQAQAIEAFNANGEEAPENDRLEIVSWETSSFLNPFYDALRDRLMHYFESIDLMRKPKLVAVTGTERGSGVSTIAAGLAAAFSETGDGRVLLVDMNLENGAAQQFFRGRPGCRLDDALELETREYALVQENLYVVTETSDSEKLQRILPKRFSALLPKLKASDYDYIIFDMPPVSQTSVTARLAGFMDMMLLVIQSEKTGRDAVQQASALLNTSNAKIGVVFNKARKYVPNRLHRQSLGDI